VYDPAAQTVALTLARRINLHRGARLTVTGTGLDGVATASGILLDGRGTGQPGSDYVATVNRTTPVFQAPKSGKHGTRTR
jgi:hypothetical protein